jgi:hypothetical protein
MRSAPDEYGGTVTTRTGKNIRDSHCGIYVVGLSLMWTVLHEQDRLLGQLQKQTERYTAEIVEILDDEKRVALRSGAIVIKGEVDFSDAMVIMPPLTDLDWIDKYCEGRWAEDKKMVIWDDDDVIPNWSDDDGMEYIPFEYKIWVED